MIEARAVGYRTAGTTLLADVSVAVEAGEVLVVVGPNGAGKSTLLRTLAGDLVPTSGEVLMGGRPLAAWPLRERAKTRAVLPQESELAFPFSAGDVVLLGRSPYAVGSETPHDRTIARLAMRRTGTLHLEDRAYPTLSGGERQRVHAARVLAQIWDTESTRPRVLLLDEPTSSLDLAHQHAILEVARDMADAHCAVVCVLHDLNLAAQYATNIAVMSGGRLRALGRPARTLTPELLREVFAIDALVVPHPELPCPLVVSRGRTERIGSRRSTPADDGSRAMRSPGEPR